MIGSQSLVGYRHELFKHSIFKRLGSEVFISHEASDVLQDCSSYIDRKSYI